MVTLPMTIHVVDVGTRVAGTKKPEGLGWRVASALRGLYRLYAAE